MSAVLGNQSPSNSRAILPDELLETDEEGRRTKIQENIMQLSELRSERYIIGDESVKQLRQKQELLVESVLNFYRFQKLTVTVLVSLILCLSRDINCII